MASLLSYIPALIAIFLILAGVPVFGQLYRATQDLNLSIILTAIYEIIIILGSFLTKVWQRLEVKWADRLSDWIDLTLQTVFSGYKSKYLEYMLYQHRVFDVKGLSTQGPYNLELEKVYVQLTVDPTPAHGANANPIHTLPKELQSGSHSIWEYIFNKNTKINNYAVLGAPGSGKTTLLKHMALTLASSKRQRKKIGAGDLLPILLFLRDHAWAIKSDRKMSLAQLIRDQFESRQAPIPPVGWLEAKIRKGSCLIMLDGLDEVADLEMRKIIVKWVEQCMISYGKNRFIISSRPFGYQSNPLENVTVLEVRPFNSLQTETFVYNWYLANEIMSSQKDDPGVREEANRGAADLLERLRSRTALQELSVNPLLLTMIATVHRYRSSLPGRRVELYAEICEVFLGKRQAARGIDLDLTPAQKIRVLRQVAYSMMEKKIREISRSDLLRLIAKPLLAVSPETNSEQFLQDIENLSGVLIELESDKYSFSHLTFQEYLAAVHIKETRREKELILHITDPWWRETILLYCAQTDASQIISACLNSPDLTALSLAIDCMDEAHEVSVKTRDQYRAVMESGLDDPDPKRRTIVANEYLRLRIQ